MPKQATVPAEPNRDCQQCPRLVDFRSKNSETYPEYFNGAVKSFGTSDPKLLIIGLAPGLHGANQTGRPFTGDAAGDLLFDCLIEAGLALGNYAKHAGDGLILPDTLITNAVRCVPPENKPVGAEINNCRPFLKARIVACGNVKVLMALGKIAHDSTIRSFGLKLADYKFGHKAIHTMPNGLTLIDSYHCSRYNVNTGRLTVEMFRDILETCKSFMA